MSEQQRHHPRICLIPDDVHNENDSHFRPLNIFLANLSEDRPNADKFKREKTVQKFFDENFMDSHRSEDLRSKLDKVTDMYQYTLTASLIQNVILPISLYLLLMMSKVVYRSTNVLGYDDRVTQEILDLSEVEDYKHDMLLYENQIPLEILELIVSIRKPEMQPPDIYKFVIDLILRFFGMPPFKEERPGSLHILDVYRKSLLQHPNSLYSGEQQPNFTKPSVIPSATKLQEARIGITERKTSCLTDISFSNKTLSLPQFSLGTNTESIFHNLVWFEKLDPVAGLHFSSYVYFISDLLGDSADSNLLKNRGIIKTVWDDDKVVGLFKELRKNIDDNPSKPMDSHVLDVGQQLRERYNKNSEGWRKDLFETYLKSPWAIISLVAAFVILSLTIIQTVYTVLGYYKS